MPTVRDTIAAIITAHAAAPVGIVRVSGPDAFSIGGRVFRGSGFNAAHAESHRIYYGHVHHPQTQEMLDEVLLLTFRRPRSYTGEDTIELSCHGGTYVLGQVLSAVLTAGARHAEPGEFTLRAFLNGRMDLAQAEAVADLIQARSARALRSALQQREGFLSRRIAALRRQALEAAATIEAWLELDEDESPPDAGSLRASLSQCAASIESLLRTSEVGKIVREGFRIAIVGRPNVGKSTLLNALAGRDRALVTPTAGTTRDVVSDTITLGGFNLTLYDTAGIRPAKGMVEEAGIQRAIEMASQADGVLFVLDARRGFTTGDQAVLQSINRPLIAVLWNKRDAVPESRLRKLLDTQIATNDVTPVLTVSALTGAGLDVLESVLNQHVRQASESSENEIVVRERHAEALRRALESLQASFRHLEGSDEIVLAAEELRRASDHLGAIIGETTSEDVVREVFARFCLGK